MKIIRKYFSKEARKERASARKLKFIQDLIRIEEMNGMLFITCNGVAVRRLGDAYTVEMALATLCEMRDNAYAMLCQE